MRIRADRTQQIARCASLPKANHFAHRFNAIMGLSFVARTCNVHGLSQVDQSVLGCFAMRLGLN